MSPDAINADISIQGYVPGAIGRVVELHALYYSESWRFGLVFEAKVASGLSAFLSQFDAERDGFWTASVGGHVEGSIAIDGTKVAAEGAHLRWFILSDALRGQGVGNRLMAEAVGFCRKKAYPRVFLWTFAGLDSARHLYEKFGFKLVSESPGTQWGAQVTEQRFVLDLD
jgi:GNAT superfamily N-acetyltransferase